MTDKDMYVDRQTFVAAPRDCSPMASRSNIVVADKFSAHLGEKSSNAYIWAKQSPHSFKEVEDPSNMKLCRSFVCDFSAKSKNSFLQKSTDFRIVPRFSTGFHIEHTTTWGIFFF